MQIDESIFKAYDIRGIYGQNLDTELAQKVGKAFVKIVNPTQVIIGRDGRISSPDIQKALVESILSIGVNVIDVGMVSTDMYYHACATKGLPGIMVTASHNPKEYNGFKMVRKIPYLLSGDDGIQDMKKAILDDNLPPLSQTPGIYTELNVMEEFIQKILSLVDVKTLKPLKIIADTANGMVGPSITELLKHIPQITLTPMYFDPDGNFPNHGGDPLQEENRAELQERVAAEGADLGVAFDPDGDRFFCIDKKGRFVSGDFMTAILSKYFLHKHPGATIVYDIRASDAVPNVITELGGKALYNKVGHAFIKRRMMDENAVFGGEVSGHYYFADYYFCDSGLAPMIFLIDLLSHTGQTLDQMVDELESKYFISGEINTKGVDSQKVFTLLDEKYKTQATEIITVDGITYRFSDWHFNVRTSNTEPLIRLNLEATSQKLMEEKRDEVISIIRS